MLEGVNLLADAGRVMSPRILRPLASSRFVLLCDHASNHVPAELDNLGLSEADLSSHIAWDIGAARSESIVIAIHSMTPVLHGEARPWQIALSSHKDRRLTDLVLAALRVPGDLLVGDDEPFCIEPLVDYSIPHHALRHGLLHLQVEFRQDEIADAAAQRHWTRRFADALSMCANVQTVLASRSKLPP